MLAIYLDNDNYLKSYSLTHQTPGCIVVDSIPDVSDEEKLFCYKYVENKFVFDSSKWEKIKETRAKEEAERAAKAEIDDAKNKLASSDYKIIKCFECSLLGLDLPYDLNDLHEERQGMRDKINELELNLSKE